MDSKYHTSADGDPVNFQVGPVQVTKVSVGEMDNNAYVLASGDGGALLIDAAADADRLLELTEGLELCVVVTTHQHHDHVQALAEVIEAADAEPFAGEPDVEAIAAQTGVVSAPVWTGDKVECGELALDVIGLVGHTPGAIALVLEDPEGGPSHIFTGDSLFPGGVGKTGSQEEFASLLDDVTREIFDRFDDETVIHPGHGDSTTLGAERPQLELWRERGW